MTASHQLLGVQNGRKGRTRLTGPERTGRWLLAVTRQNTSHWTRTDWSVTFLCNKTEHKSLDHNGLVGDCSLWQDRTQVTGPQRTGRWMLAVTRLNINHWTRTDWSVTFLCDKTEHKSLDRNGLVGDCSLWQDKTVCREIATAEPLRLTVVTHSKKTDERAKEQTHKQKWKKWRRIRKRQRPTHPP